MRFRLADHGRTFATRPRGAELRDVLLRDAEGSEAIEVDFTAVLSVSYSFADEFVAALVQTTRAQDRRPRFVGASPEVARVVRRALANRNVEADATLSVASPA